MLFMEKFQYNPGQEDFPTIYVKDPHTNIHYELESLGDVKQNAFLSLNVDGNDTFCLHRQKGGREGKRT